MLLVDAPFCTQSIILLFQYCKLGTYYKIHNTSEQFPHLHSANHNLCIDKKFGLPYINYIKDRSREQVGFSAARSLRKGAAGFELIYRGEMKEPPFLAVPTL